MTFAQFLALVGMFFNANNPSPTLTVSYQTAWGDSPVAVGMSGVFIGALTFDPSEPMWVDEFTVTTFVKDEPFEPFANYSQGNQNGIVFEDHFRSCWAWDQLGNTIASPVDPSQGSIRFVDPFHIDGIFRLSLYCNHTGLLPVGEYDGFSTDIPLDANNIMAQTDAGAPVTPELGNNNGYAAPSTRFILGNNF